MSSGLTTDPNDPRLPRRHGPDTESVPQQEVYLVLSDEERAKGFVRPVRDAYKHIGPPEGEGMSCGTTTTMGRALAETYAANPSYYGATYCVRCSMHRPVGAKGEFVWLDGSRVGT